MDISEVLQRRPGAPVGEAVEREVHHHRAGSGAEPRHIPLEFGARGVARDEIAENDFWVDVGDDRLRVEPLSTLQGHARRRPAGHLDPGDPLAEHELAAFGLERAHHGLHDRVGAAQADHHPETLVDHAFQIGEQGAARDVWRKIEMQAPGRHHRLDLRVFEARIEKVPRRRDEELQRVEKPRSSFLPPGFPDDLGGPPGRHRRSEQGEQMRGVAAEPLQQRLPGLGVGRRQGGDPCERLFQRAAYPEIRPVAEYGGETILRRRESEPVRQKLILVRLKKGRACKHGEVHGADVVAEAWKRQLPRLDRASRLAFRLDDRDSPASLREAEGRRQAIVPRADNDRVISPLSVGHIACISKLCAPADGQNARRAAAVAAASRLLVVLIKVNQFPASQTARLFKQQMEPARLTSAPVRRNLPFAQEIKDNYTDCLCFSCGPPGPRRCDRFSHPKH